MNTSFNTRYYPIYNSLVYTMAWVPVFFLFFNDFLSMKEVLMLESVYYMSVFVLEVPSGYFSDKMGRKKTLVISSLAFFVSYAIFSFAEPSLIVFGLAQFLFACGFSFMSGTNTSFYYESLKEIGQEEAYPENEAKVQSYQRYASGLAALLGGFLGSMNLAWAYVASLILMIPAIWISLKFSEPAGFDKSKIPKLREQMRTVLNYLQVKELKWLFVFSVIVYVLVHIPYEFYQPYLKLLENKGVNILSYDAAIYSGILLALTRFVGGLTSRYSITLVNKFGLRQMFVLSMILQIVLIGIFSIVLHPIFILLIIGRSISISLTAAPVNALIAPRVNKEQRATYFSFQSLASRLSFSIVLIILSIPIAEEVVNDWSTLSMIFRNSLLIAAVISLPLLLMKSGNLFKKNKI